MNDKPGAFSEESGKQSFTRWSGAVVLAVLLLVFAWTAGNKQWQFVSSMFDSLLVLVGMLYFTNQGAKMLGAATGHAIPATPPEPKQPGTPQPLPGQ